MERANIENMMTTGAKGASHEGRSQRSAARSMWLAGLLTLAWLLLAAFQLAFGANLVFSGASYVVLAAGLLGVAANLVAQPGLKWRLVGVGLVWAWLAAAGSLVTVVTVIIAVVTRIPGAAIPGATRPYTFQLMLGLCGLTGYILLLCKKRVGIYPILIGTGLLLVAQIASAVSYLDLPYGLVLLISSLLGTLNPLFAWLAVRCGVAEVGEMGSAC